MKVRGGEFCIFGLHVCYCPRYSEGQIWSGYEVLANNVQSKNFRTGLGGGEVETTLRGFLPFSPTGKEKQF